MGRNISTLIQRLTVVLVVVVIIVTTAVVIAAIPKSHESLQLGTGVFKTDILVSESDRERGLSGSKELLKTDAMLFVFPQNGKWGIWMKDMNYPIDIVWLDESKTVVFIKQNADPGNYPEVYKPTRNARYVVELAAGTIKDKNIRIGSTAKFKVEGE